MTIIDVTAEGSAELSENDIHIFFFIMQGVRRLNSQNAVCKFGNPVENNEN